MYRANVCLLRIRRVTRDAFVNSSTSLSGVLFIQTRESGRGKSSRRFLKRAQAFVILLLSNRKRGKKFIWCTIYDHLFENSLSIYRNSFFFFFFLWLRGLLVACVVVVNNLNCELEYLERLDTKVWVSFSFYLIFWGGMNFIWTWKIYILFSLYTDVFEKEGLLNR